jgi:hypothetical protein
MRANRIDAIAQFENGDRSHARAKAMRTGAVLRLFDHVGAIVAMTNGTLAPIDYAVMLLVDAKHQTRYGLFVHLRPPQADFLI